MESGSAGCSLWSGDGTASVWLASSYRIGLWLALPNPIVRIREEGGSWLGEPDLPVSIASKFK